MSMSSSIRRVAVAGSGTMGLGIAHVSALGGFETVLYDIDSEQLRRARAQIEANLQKGVDRGKLDAGAREGALARLSTTTELSEACAKSGALIEAIPERIDLKLEFLARVDALLPEDALVATNTSALSITEMAAALRDPSRCIGMHFFNPVHLMKLVEVIRGLQTSDESCAVALELARALGKEPVEVNEAPGFVTTRVNALIGNEAFRMLQEGVASAEDIDTALKLGLNHPMGPFELVDLVGLDTRLSILEFLHRSLGDRFRPTSLQEKYVKAGRLGRKTGRGVFDYGEEL
jgi:3-hydroxybutyryl-CoA dehydrogenase